GATRARFAPRPRGRRRRRKPFLAELPLILTVAVVLSLLLKTFVMQAFYIPSTSMQPTLEIGDRVFVSKLSTRFGEVHRGDVVVFRDPGGWLPDVAEPPAGGPVRTAVRDALVFLGLAPSATGDDLIKRVIGVGGDRVRCCDARGRVTVNGTALDEPYILGGDAPSEVDFDVRVPRGSVWVMGDHRAVSEDSRFHRDDPRAGMVPVDDVIGRAFVVVWPAHRWTGLGRPETFEGVGGP
ncbi:MAG: signal peptidase I, partial [Actinomycetota bacterium]|nr:signal peptidase I [Actinomycetota bacterium]